MRRIIHQCTSCALVLLMMSCSKVNSVEAFPSDGNGGASAISTIGKESPSMFESDNNDDTSWGSVSSAWQKPGSDDLTNNLIVDGDDEDEDEDVEVDIAIIGGGIAGLAAAVGLRRHGISCRVYERAPRLRSVSQGMLAIRPNGHQALQQIHPDLPNMVSRAGCMLETITSDKIDADGNTETVVRSLKGSPADKYGHSTLISWHSLQQTIASLLPTEDIVMTGKALSFFSENKEKKLVRLHFEDGSCVRCRAGLACDGTFSAVRRQIIDPAADRPIYFGQLNWNSIVPTSTLFDEVHPKNAVRAVSGETGGQRWTAYLNDCGGDITFWQIRITDPAKAMALSGTGGRGGLGPKGIVQSLLTFIGDASPHLAEVVRRTPEKQIFERSIIGRMPAPTWRSKEGRVALVGDAAHGMHPNIGQGGNSALESAAVAIEELVKCDRDYCEGLKKYEAIRKPRADIVHSFANLMGCTQSSGSKLIDAKESGQINDWIYRGGEREALDLPQDVIDMLVAFDPCSQSGVSFL